MFKKKTVEDVKLAGKTVLVRVDYNVPVNADGTVGDLYRVKGSLETIKHLIEQKCKIILISHLGRPAGKPNPKLSLRPVAGKLTELLGKPVQFTEDCVGPEAQQKAQSLRTGDVLLLENLRFHPEEEANDGAFAKQLAALAEVFVQDGFGVVHRAHASTSGVTKYLPSVAGFLLAKEVRKITEAVDKPKQPLLVILGGAKVSDKIALLDRFMGIAKQLVIGGAMANTFLKQMGYNIGQSVYEEAAVGEAERVRFEAKQKGVSLLLPTADVAVSNKRDPSAERAEKMLAEVKDSEYILDFGPQTINDIQELIRTSGSVIWNGPVGMTEYPNFTSGSLQISNAIKEAGLPSLAGGGDTAAFLEANNLLEAFDWVSTGGGAALELMAGKKLPGIEALQAK